MQFVSTPLFINPAYQFSALLGFLHPKKIMFVYMMEV